MTDLIISGVLADQIREMAQGEGYSIEDMLSDLLTQRKTAQASDDTAPGATLRDEDIDVPDDILENERQEYRDLYRATLPSVYQVAREYWANVGDHERLALTNRELDQQFWCIDIEGVPHLKSEQGVVELPPDPLDSIVGLFDGLGAPADLSSTVRETMAEHYRRELERLENDRPV